MYERTIEGVTHYHFTPEYVDCKVEDNPLGDTDGDSLRLKLRLSEDVEGNEVFLHLDRRAVDYISRALHENKCRG